MNELIYNVGDKVLIKKGLVQADKMYGIFRRDIEFYEGKEATIERVNEYENNYNIDIDNGAWFWAPFQIEDAIPNKCYDCSKFNICDKKRCLLNE